jgi:hypothetical protein
MALALRRRARHVRIMIGFLVNIISILIGLIALPIAFVGLIPVLGIANYLAIPIALVGTVVGMVSGHKSGRNFNLVVLIVAVIRLILGHGFL